ncbi:MAG: glycosyltransferase family 4 protein [Treponema sp.]|nr:glycosyltransferase family 4 protein [Treponema sp.]
MIKVGIDTFGCDHGRSGLGSCLFYLTSNLPAQDEDIQFELFGSETDRFTFTGNNGFSFQAVQIADNLRAEQSWHHRGGIKIFVIKNAYDLVIYPAVSKVFPFTFIKNGIALVNTVLSASIEKMNFVHKKLLKHGLSKVKLIIAGTEYIKNDLTKLGIPEEKIRVIYNGIDHKLFFPKPIDDEEAVEVSPFSIKRPYFIYGSKLSDKDKKHLELIKAFEIFKRNTGLPHRLVLAGEDGDFSKEIHDAVFKSEFATDIFLTGFFPHESFATLYTGAEACIFPAVNEGIGLPVLEAMACGIPVLCSKSGALKEVGGHAPLYFDSDDSEEIAAAMKRVIEDKELRIRMVDLGLIQAGKYNWTDTVNALMKVIKQITEIK